MDAQYDHLHTQSNLKNRWFEEKIYSHSHNPGPLYSIDTPPPTVSGTLHIGHVFSYTQTDVIARYKRMDGYSVFYPMGFDDNGLPTERFVENSRGIKAYMMARSEFIAICLEETHKAEKGFQDLWQQLGLSVDWQYCYSTISDRVRKLSQESFIDLYNKGFIYRSHEPALYCTFCRTSVAQAELDDKEVPSFFNDIVFKDAAGNDLIIGTTRPELLSSCVALLFNPNDERYQHLKNTYVTTPFFNKQVPVYEDESVSIDKGTGLVMCCTFGDKMDVEWYKKFALPYVQSIGLDGKFLSDTGILAGLNVHDARAKMIEALKNENLLIRQQPIIHAVSIHERCKKEIEFLALAQWFINVLDYKKEFLALADQIAWYPSFMKVRYINWVENLNWNWCISRQRFFGISFPVWHCNDCKNIILADIQQLPLDPQETAYNGKCPSCNSNNITPDTDVMDTWNTSSITPYICKDLFANQTGSPFANTLQEFMPMSMRPQAHDIIRTWAFYTIVKSWMHEGKAPWSNIVVSGHVLSTQKEKISKSQGNSPMDPVNLLKNYAADAIRYWTSAGTLGYDSPFSEQQLKNGQRLITKLWNAFRFTASHIQSINSQEAPASLGAVNEWILHEATTVFAQYKKALDMHEFGHALSCIEKFFWQDFCDNYIELIKNQLFNPQEYAADQVKATQWTLYHIGLQILQWYAPYVPFITEAIYQELYVTKNMQQSLHQTRFADIQQKVDYAASAKIMERVIHIVDQIRKLKSEHKISLKVPIETLDIYSDDADLCSMIQQYEQLIKGVTHAVTVRYHHESLESSSMITANDVWHAKVNC